MICPVFGTTENGVDWQLFQPIINQLKGKDTDKTFNNFFVSRQWYVDMIARVYDEVVVNQTFITAFDSIQRRQGAPLDVVNVGKDTYHMKTTISFPKIGVAGVIRFVFHWKPYIVKFSARPSSEFSFNVDIIVNTFHKRVVVQQVTVEGTGNPFKADIEGGSAPQNYCKDMKSYMENTVLKSVEFSIKERLEMLLSGVRDFETQ